MNGVIRKYRCFLNNVRASGMFPLVRNTRIDHSYYYERSKHLLNYNISSWHSIARYTTTSDRNLKPLESETPRRCWNCDAILEGRIETFFCKCGVVMKPDLHSNYFQLHGLEQRYNIDTAELSKIYKFLQTRLHPDKFALKSDKEREYAEAQSALLNDSYRTLQKPLSRGLYLLQLHGQTIDKVSGDYSTQEFLMTIMKLNEQLTGVTDMQGLTRLQSQIREVSDSLFAELAAAFESNNIDLAKSVLIQLKYYNNLEEKIKDLYLDLSGR